MKTQPNEEVLEILELLEAPVEGDGDLQATADLLAAAMTEHERLTKERAAATAALRKQLDEECAPYKEPLELQQAVIDAAKAAIIARILADEKAADAAIAAKVSVPEPRKLPKGLVVRRTAVVSDVDLDALDDRFLTAVADVDGILAAHASGEAVVGVKIETNTAVSLNRKSAAA